jgi:hypothetical protein
VFFRIERGQVILLFGLQERCQHFGRLRQVGALQHQFPALIVCRFANGCNIRKGFFALAGKILDLPQGHDLISAHRDFHLVVKIPSLDAQLASQICQLEAGLFFVALAFAFRFAFALAFAFRFAFRFAFALISLLFLAA